MLDVLPALLLFLFPLAYSPGPGNLFFAANCARFGFVATLPANLGYHLATWLVTFGIGLSAQVVLTSGALAFEILRYAGTAYVLWIAIRMIRSDVLTSGQRARTAGLWDGALLLLLNPKAFVIIGLMFTQFTPQNTGASLGFVMGVTTAFMLNNLVAFVIWTLFGAQIGKLFRSARAGRALNIGLGGLLASVALWMAL